MRKLQIIAYTLVVYLACTMAAYGQCVATATDPCVEVHQSVLDRLSKVVDEYKAAQDVIAKQSAALLATDAERAAVKSYMSTVDATIAVLQKGIADRDTVIALQQKAMEAFVNLVDKLAAQINKKQSAFSKFVQTLEKIVVLLAGVAIGGAL